MLSWCSSHGQHCQDWTWVRLRKSRLQAWRRATGNRHLVSAHTSPFRVCVWGLVSPLLTLTRHHDEIASYHVERYNNICEYMGEGGGLPPPHPPESVQGSWGMGTWKTIFEKHEFWWSSDRALDPIRESIHVPLEAVILEKCWKIKIVDPPKHNETIMKMYYFYRKKKLINIYRTFFWKCIKDIHKHIIEIYHIKIWCHRMISWNDI